MIPCLPPPSSPPQPTPHTHQALLWRNHTATASPSWLFGPLGQLDHSGWLLRLSAVTPRLAFALPGRDVAFVGRVHTVLGAAPGGDTTPQRDTAVLHEVVADRAAGGKVYRVKALMESNVALPPLVEPGADGTVRFCARAVSQLATYLDLGRFQRPFSLLREECGGATANPDPSLGWGAGARVAAAVAASYAGLVAAVAVAQAVLQCGMSYDS